MLLANRLRAAITKPLLPVAFFLGGVTFDSVTLTRIDRLRDNLIMLLYLSLLGGLIVLTDRKSTRLNSSHSQISYAVFCLKKKQETRKYRFQRLDAVRHTRHCVRFARLRLLL